VNSKGNLSCKERCTSLRGYGARERRCGGARVRSEVQGPVRGAKVRSGVQRSGRACEGPVGGAKVPQWRVESARNQTNRNRLDLAARRAGTGAVSRDGKTFAFSAAVPGGEIWTIPLQDKPVATPYFANGFNLGHPTLSPDGRWMACDSDESGQGVDVFIQSVPRPAAEAAQGVAIAWIRAAVDARRARTRLPRGRQGHGGEHRSRHWREWSAARVVLGTVSHNPGWTRPAVTTSLPTANAFS
jgi:WD40 repeat protein